MSTTKVISPKKTKEQFDYENENFLKPIKKRVPKAPSGRIHHIKLPSYMSFRIEKDTKTLFIHMEEQEGTCSGKLFIDNPTSSKNMQEDNAAFEGWAICLMAWLPDIIEKVVLKWDKPINQSEENTLHYNRFLYRVLRFSEYYDWFSVDAENIQSIDNFKTILTGLSNNCFSDKPKLKEGRDKSKLSETVVEYLFANYFSSTIKRYYKLNIIDRQFPVGVKKDGKQFFTGNMSAIDLWGINDDILTIIELKYNGDSSNNVRVGIISELFMYSCVMQDIIKGTIDRSENTINDNEKFFYDNLKVFREIKAEMLSDKYHPLVESEKVIEILNKRRKYTDDIAVTYRKSQYKINELVSFV